MVGGLGTGSRGGGSTKILAIVFLVRRVRADCGCVARRDPVAACLKGVCGFSGVNRVLTAGEKNEKREFISDIWGKRGATYGEKGVCRFFFLITACGFAPLRLLACARRAPLRPVPTPRSGSSAAPRAPTRGGRSVRRGSWHRAKRPETSIFESNLTSLLFFFWTNGSKTDAVQTWRKRGVTSGGGGGWGVGGGEVSHHGGSHEQEVCAC